MFNFTEKAIQFFGNLSNDIGLDFNLLRMDPPNLFALWMTWNGTDPSLKSVMLDSHMDVVQADPVRQKYY